MTAEKDCLDWDGDPALQKLRADFLASFPGKVKALSAARNSNQAKEVQSLLHQFAGTMGSYGFPLMSEICGILDDRLDVELTLQPALLNSVHWIEELLLELAAGGEESPSWRNDPRWPS